MSDQGTRENGDELELEPFLRDGLRSLKDKKGPCPGADQLERFHAKLLSADESRAIQQHVALCGLCDLKLGRLAEADPSAQLPPSVWEQVDPRLSHRFEEFLAYAQQPRWPPLFRPIAGWFARPAVAYCLALLLCYPAYLGLTNLPHHVVALPAPKASSPPPRVQAARVLDLNRERLGKGEANEFNLRDQDKVFILTFMVPVRSGKRYTAEIHNKAGASIMGKEEVVSADQANFYLVCYREWFSAGSYVLTVMESDPDSGLSRLIDQFPFKL